MAAFCLLKNEVDKFRDALRTGQIDPAKLIGMTSAERREFFSKIVGEDNAKDVNRLLEEKLLLKNQKQGLVTWAEGLLGLRPKAKQDLISRIGRMDKVLTPASQQAFLEDLASHKLGVGVSMAEAKQINDLANNAISLKAQLDAGTLPDRMDYGRAAYDLRTYIADLKKNANKITFQDFKDAPLRTIGKGIMAIPGQSKGINAAFDDSAVARHGWKAMFTHPAIWFRNSLRSFKDIQDTFGSAEVERELQADILSRPNYELMKKAKLDVVGSEEDFPTALPEKVPYLGRLYKASENAFSGMIKRTRADIFDKYIDIANKTGVDLHDTQLKQIGRMVNALTGRGDLGKLEQVGSTINNVMFSPKFLKSHIDVLMQPLTGGSKVGDLVDGEAGSSFVRKQATVNLMKIIIGNAAILGIAKALAPNSVTFDPRSADFGKIRIGDTRFDVSGGMSSLATLATRLLSGKTVSGGKLTDLNARGASGKPNPMARTGLDLIEDFFENKTSPAASVMLDVLKGETRSGYPLTMGTSAGFAGREAVNLFTPLPVKNAVENLSNPNSAPFLLNLLADGLGVAANTYSSDKDLQEQIKEAEKNKDTKEVERLTKAAQQLKETEKKQIAEYQDSENIPNTEAEIRQAIQETRKQIKSDTPKEDRKKISEEIKGLVNRLKALRKEQNQSNAKRRPLAGGN